MKKFILLFAFFGAVALVNVNAQCHGSKASTASTTSEEGKASLAKTVSLEEGIEERTDAQTGKTSYVRKEVNAQTGKVSYTEVEYCSKSGKFTNVSPSKKSCCAGEGKASKVSNDKKACAEGAAAGCCDKKGKSASSTSTGNSTKVKLVKGE
ncbi:MAG: hypothetical protein HUU34_20865 [Saprospiraceae bacterium]|jgi:hypothetical protein|nr:hypothetical protein [Saprospiraceae bacterium]